MVKCCVRRFSGGGLLLGEFLVRFLDAVHERDAADHLPEVLGAIEAVTRNVTTNGCRSSLRLERPFFEMLEEICRREETTLSELCSELDRKTGKAKNLSSVIRVFVLRYFAAAATEAGHRSGTAWLRGEVGMGCGRRPLRTPRDAAGPQHLRAPRPVRRPAAERRSGHDHPALDERAVLPGPIPAEVIQGMGGDTRTVRASVWLGHSAHSMETRVRLDGIDTPERRAPCPQEKQLAQAARERPRVLGQA